MPTKLVPETAAPPDIESADFTVDQGSVVMTAGGFPTVAFKAAYNGPALSADMEWTAYSGDDQVASGQLNPRFNIHSPILTSIVLPLELPNVTKIVLSTA